MEFSQSALSREVEAIYKRGDTGINYTYSATIHVNGKSMMALKVLDINYVCDYVSSRADNVSIRLIYTALDWVRSMYDHRDNLYMTVVRTPLYESSDGVNYDNAPVAIEYKAVPKIEGLPVLKGTDAEQWDDHTIDIRLGAIEIEFQLTDKTYEMLRTVTVGGVYRKATGEDVMKYIIASESDKLPLPVSQQIEHLNVVPANNTAIQEQLIIPDGVALTDVATHLQNRCGGIYNGGMACYYTNRAWWVFPPFDTTLLPTSRKTLTIFKVPQQKNVGSERTFRREGDNIFVIATANIQFSDDNGSNYLNQGAGNRFTDADKIMAEEILANKDNKSVIARSKLNNEYTLTDKSNKEPIPVYTSGTRITSNNFAQMTEALARKGGAISVKWENADYTLLEPGMRVKVVWGVGNEIKELTGVLVLMQGITQARGKGMITNTHQSTCVLSVFVNEPNAIINAR